MFSTRLDWEKQRNALSVLLDSKRRSGIRIVDLTESNPTRAGLLYPAEEMLNALAAPRAIDYEPCPAGLFPAREAVAEYYAARGEAVSPARMLLTASTSEAYGYIFKLLCNAGDEVLVPRPSYPLFEYLAALEHVRPISYRLIYHDEWSIDMDYLAGAITPRTRAVVVVNPNNPTGSFLKQDELRQLQSLCTQHGLAIISDEVFSDYSLRNDSGRVASLVSGSDVLIFCLSGLSKIAGMPQMKLSWIVLAGPLPQQEAARERLELIADSYLSVSTPVQQAAPQLLKAGQSIQSQIQERIRANFSRVRTTITFQSRCSLLDIEGGWYAILQVPRTRTEEQ